MHRLPALVATEIDALVPLMHEHINTLLKECAIKRLHCSKRCKERPMRWNLCSFGQLLWDPTSRHFPICQLFGNKVAVNFCWIVALGLQKSYYTSHLYVCPLFYGCSHLCCDVTHACAQY